MVVTRRRPAAPVVIDLTRLREPARSIAASLILAGIAAAPGVALIACSLLCGWLLAGTAR